jgi:lysophospholipase L1-like esterase
LRFPNFTLPLIIRAFMIKLTSLFLALTLSAVVADEAKNYAVQPVPRDAGWLTRHESFNAISKQGKAPLVFLGDSITQGWSGKGKEAWANTWAPMGAVNFGIGGDRTEHVLWRLENGNFDGLKPKLVVLMIGTNNMANLDDQAIANGVIKCVGAIRTRLPATKILLLAIFPRSPKATDPVRARLKHINEIIAKLDDGGKTVRFLDIGAKFLDANGDIPVDIMPDALHPNSKGYQIWADAVQPVVAAMME